MKKIANFIVNHQKLVVIAYIVMLIFSIIGMQFVKIEYDLSSYLPKDMNSIQGKDMLQKEFEINGTATLMIESNDLYHVKELKDKIKNIPTVKSVTWLDDVEDIHKPREFFDEKLTKKFVSGDYSLLQIQFTEGNDTMGTRKAIGEIDNLVDKEHYFGGPAAVSKDMQDTSSREMIYYSIAAFVIITIILLISSNAYHEPLLFFAAIGAAILLNMGTNLIFGKVSSNTNSVSSILQLAVSMDYSIFLLHRFHEEALKTEKKQAMAIAIEKSFGSVSASALTTVCGFLALVAMKYGIGKDMGLVLAKGVLLSLLTVVTLMPCIILAVDERFSKYRHKIYLPNFTKHANKIVSLRHIALVLSIIIVLPAFLAQNKVNYYYATEKNLSDRSTSAVANRKIQEVFGKANELVLIIPKGDNIKINKLIADISAAENVDSVQGLNSMVDTTLPDLVIPKEVIDNFQSEKYTYYIINLLSSMEGNATTKTIEKIRSISQSYYKEWYLTGEAAIFLDLQTVTSKDFSKVNNLSIIMIALILLLTFKSLLIPAILVFVIQLSIWINLAIPYFQDIPLNFISFIIIGAIQLGATVDYAILLTSRFKENLEEFPPLMAMKKTIADTGRSILTSGLILMAGTLSVSFITTIVTASELTLLIGRGAFISLLLVFLILPALLLIFNPLIQYTTIGWPKTVQLLKKKGANIYEKEIS